MKVGVIKMGKKAIKELKKILNIICLEFGERLTGSTTNKQVQEYIKSYLQKNRFKVELQNFTCLDWKTDGAKLLCNDKKVTARPSYDIVTKRSSFVAE
jgi:Iap family predicted aminopeptidase